MAEEFRTEWIPGYGPSFWESKQVNRRLTPSQLLEIVQKHTEQEDALLTKANRFFFTDTNAITTATFARYHHGTIQADLAALADQAVFPDQAVFRYDPVFLCDNHIPCSDTPDRAGEVRRSEFQRQVVGDLHRRKVPCIVLQGSLE